MSHDLVNRVMTTNEVEIWATHDRCGMTARPIKSRASDSLGERIEFDDPTIRRSRGRSPA